MSTLYAASEKIASSGHNHFFGQAKVWTLTSPSFSLQGTTHSAQGTDDQIGWTQGLPYFKDKNLNDIAVIQFNSGSVANGFIYRNVGGSWADASTNEGALIHGASAYDATNNLIHVLWYSTGLGDANGDVGYVYRRYVIQYSGANITNIVSDNGITIGGSSTRTNLVVDAQTVANNFLGELPSLVFVPNGTYGTLVAMWPLRNTTGVELRISMCAMGASSSAGKTAGGWTNPFGGATATTTIGGTAPYVAYGKAYVNVAASQLIAFSSLYQKASGTNIGDLCIVYVAGSSVGTYAYKWVRMRYNSGSSNWSTGLSTPVAIANIQRAGTDTGYSLKYQILSNIVEDASGNCFIGIATWKDNTSGDTWGYAQILDSAETVALADAYSAGGAHSYAPTGHIAYDPAKGLLVVSYIKTSTQFAFVQAFAGTTQKIGETALFSAAKVDIPYFLSGNPTVGTDMPMILRDAPVQPHAGYSGKITWQ
jgi:hypothetical protein